MTSPRTAPHKTAWSAITQLDQPGLEMLLAAISGRSEFQSGGPAGPISANTSAAGAAPAVDVTTYNSTVVDNKPAHCDYTKPIKRTIEELKRSENFQSFKLRYMLSCHLLLAALAS